MVKSIKVLYQNGSVRIAKEQTGENSGIPKVLAVESNSSQDQVNPQIYYDPGNASSYSRSGTILNNIGTLGNATGTVGTLSAGLDYDSEIAGGVFNFDGTDQITFGQFNFGSSITVSAWIYPRNKTSINTLMSNAAANLSTNGFKLEWNNWQTTDLKMLIEAGNGSSGGILQSADPVIVENQWQHLTWVIDFTVPSAALYKDGALLLTTGSIVSNISTNNSNWYIGSMVGFYQMNANMGEFKLWKSAKEAIDITSEFNNTKNRYGL